jgi:hypothetical protein
VVYFYINCIEPNALKTLTTSGRIRMVPRAGFEPATTRSSAERSPRLSYLGTQQREYKSKVKRLALKFSDWAFAVLVWIPSFL